MPEVPITWGGFEGKDAARQWQTMPDGRIRVEVRWGDKDPRYTEHRALETAQGIRLNEGDVVRLRWTTEIPTDFIATSYPKQDELESWPSVYLDACSILEIHDAPGDGPPMNGDWGRLPAGGAPIYTRITRQGHGITWPDPQKPEAQGYLSATAPLVLGVKNQHVLTFKSSADPLVGWLEYTINGVTVVGRRSAKTMYQGTYNYVMGGVYSRLSIGDPNLLWYVDAKPGVAYPGEFTPAKGQRVYKRDDGYPRVILFGDATAELNPTDQGVTVPTPPQPPAPPQPQDFATAHPKANAGLQLLIAQVPKLQDHILQLDAAITALQQQRDAAQKLHDDTVSLLDRGPWS